MSQYRIPPSLKWLIRNQQVISARLRLANKEITKMQSELEHAKNVIQKHKTINELVSILESDLAAIEHSIGLHEIPIDLSKLKPVTPHINSPMLKYGELTRLIFSALNTKPERWLSTNEVAAYVITHADFNSAERRGKTAVLYIIRNALKRLFYTGKIDKITKGELVKEGYWRQKPFDHTNVKHSEFLFSNDCLANNHENRATDLIELDSEPLE